MRIASWRGKILFYAIRGHLIRLIFESSFMHNFHVYKWPSCLLKKLRGWCCTFLCTGDNHRSKHAIVSWAKVYCSIDSDGLEILDFGSPLKSAYFYFFRLSTHSVISTCLCSWIWPNVKRIFSVFFYHVRWMVGNGLKVCLWKDR